MYTDTHSSHGFAGYKHYILNLYIDHRSTGHKPLVSLSMTNRFGYTGCIDYSLIVVCRIKETYSNPLNIVFSILACNQNLENPLENYNI